MRSSRERASGLKCTRLISADAIGGAGDAARRGAGGRRRQEARRHAYYSGELFFLRAECRPGSPGEKKLYPFPPPSRKQVLKGIPERQTQIQHPS